MTHSVIIHGMPWRPKFYRDDSALMKRVALHLGLSSVRYAGSQQQAFNLLKFNKEGVAIFMDACWLVGEFVRPIANILKEME